LIRLETVLISVQDWARFAPNVPHAWKSIWSHPIKLLGEVGQVEACFDLFEDSVNLNARSRYGLQRPYHMLENRFGCTQRKTHLKHILRHDEK